jgi:hypothetical protein
MPPTLLIESLEQVWRLLDTVAPIKAIACGLALSFWGYPRSTQDIDIAILLSQEMPFVSLQKHLVQSGLRLKNRSPQTQLGQLSVSQWLFPIQDAYLDIQVDVLFGDSTYYQTAMRRRMPCVLEGARREMQVLSCEDILLFKALAGRMIDLSDIRELVARNRESLQWEYIHAWAANLGVNLSIE